MVDTSVEFFGMDVEVVWMSMIGCLLVSVLTLAVNCGIVVLDVSFSVASVLLVVEPVVAV